MKFIVEVNRKYLVSVESTSNGGAEHRCLDLEGVRSALSFDSETVKTDTFAGAMMVCTTISYEELEEISKTWHMAKEELEEINNKKTEISEQIADLQKQLETVNGNWKEQFATVTSMNEMMGLY